MIFWFWMKVIAAVGLAVCVFLSRRKDSAAYGLGFAVLALVTWAGLETRSLDGLFPGYVAPDGNISKARWFVTGVGGTFTEREAGRSYSIVLRGKSTDDRTLDALSPLVRDIQELDLTLEDTDTSCEGARRFQFLARHRCVVHTEDPACRQIGPEGVP